MSGENRDIIEFIELFRLMGNIKMSPAQTAILKSLYGLDLDPRELEIFKRGTGREFYVPGEYSELSVLAGRQSGKTSIIASLIAVFEAFQPHGLPPGQRGYVLIISLILRQAAIAFHFIKNYILNSSTLSQYVLKIRKDEIELKNGAIIACRPCTSTTVRGVPVICAILDEMCYWAHEETAANPEREVLNAIRPAMATLSQTKLIKVSTPNRTEGILYEEFQNRGQLEHYFWQLSSEEMNPSIPSQFLEKARIADEATYRREHLAEFLDHSIRWIAPQLLESCITRGVHEFPRVYDGIYSAAIDPAFRSSSDFALAILHRSNCGNVTVACAMRWTGTKALEMVCHQVQQKLEFYGVNALVGDQFCFPILKQHFATLGIHYREVSFGSGTRASIFGNLRQLMTQGKINFIDNAPLHRQLLSLVEIPAANGNVDIRAPRSSKDDLAVAVGVAASEFPIAALDWHDPVILGGAAPIVVTYDAFGFPMVDDFDNFLG